MNSAKEFTDSQQESRLQSLEVCVRETSAAVAGLAVQVEVVGEKLERGFESLGKKVDKTNDTLQDHAVRLARVERHVDVADAAEETRKDIRTKITTGVLLGLLGFFASNIWTAIQSVWGAIHAP